MTEREKKKKEKKKKALKTCQEAALNVTCSASWRCVSFQASRSAVALSRSSCFFVSMRLRSASSSYNTATGSLSLSDHV